MSNINQNELNNDSYEKIPAIIKYFIISFLINITMIMFNVFSSRVRLNKRHKCFIELHVNLPPSRLSMGF